MSRTKLGLAIIVATATLGLSACNDDRPHRNGPPPRHDRGDWNDGGRDRDHRGDDHRRDRDRDRGDRYNGRPR